MSLREDRVQFAALVAAMAVYLALGQLDASAEDAPGDDPVPTYLLLVVAAGVAFAPGRWREVAPLAGIATAVVVVVQTFATVLAGRIPGVLARDTGETWQVLIGIYVMHFLCLSIGFAIFKMMKRRAP